MDKAVYFGAYAIHDGWMDDRLIDGWISVLLGLCNL